jgi:membrane-associated protease RseP (regulator of RpoE activity)
MIQNFPLPVQSEEIERVMTSSFRPGSQQKRVWIHILLFVLTIFSTYFVGLGDGPIGALWYSLGLIIILLSHEMGHYLLAKKHGVPATLPYFIPVPLPPFGTMGAVIKMEGRIPNRRALFDVGVAGPLAGLVMIIPAIIIGIKNSQIVEIASLEAGTITLGDSLLFKLLAYLAVGSLPEGQDILLHPLAYAGWVGLLVTALNLLPIGQLDGGHITYALFWKKSKVISRIFYGIFLIICLFFYAGWLLLVIVLSIFHRHPPTLNDTVPLDKKRQVLGILTLIVFVLAFTPVPFGFAGGLIPMIIKAIQP